MAARLAPLWHDSSWHNWLSCTHSTARLRPAVSGDSTDGWYDCNDRRACVCTVLETLLLARRRDAAVVADITLFVGASAVRCSMMKHARTR